ncbi:hypothetical protein MTO96_018722 [Rhipicephalus appendiculatus]
MNDFAVEITTHILQSNIKEFISSSGISGYHRQGGPTLFRLLTAFSRCTPRATLLSPAEQAASLRGAAGINPMESAASGGAAQDTDADVRTMDVQQDGDEAPATTNSEEGWHTVQHGRRRKPGHGSAGDGGGSHGATNKVEPSSGNTHTKAQERRINRIEKASRMPKLPAGDYKVVIRPRGGLCVAALGPTDITRGIHEATATPPEVKHFDVICPNKTQNIMAVSTPDPDRAVQYRKIRKIVMRGK